MRSSRTHRPPTTSRAGRPAAALGALTLLASGIFANAVAQAATPPRALVADVVGPAPSRSVAVAGTALATCLLGSTTTTYSPGVRTQSATVRVDVEGLLGVCVSTDPGASTGIYTEHASVPLACTQLLAGGTGSRVFTWQDGTTSTFDFTRAVNAVNGQLVNTFTGSITQGKFAGRSATQVVTALADLTACQTAAGLTSTQGTGVLTIL
ncbi:hypothetical protein ACFVY7_12860 [[Kitasatospora] papulosa]|uniref:hypothetical protein n=1 Tax=[Kitasatospora] papulosa TaxID=1464011 RepID=UPI00369FF2AC